MTRMKEKKNLLSLFQQLYDNNNNMIFYISYLMLYKV